MPETRHRTKISYPEGLSGAEKTLDKATITQEPYEVSDEEIEADIEREAKEIAIQRITDAEKANIRAKRGMP